MLFTLPQLIELINDHARVIHLTGNLFKVVPPPKGSPAGQPEAVVTGQWRYVIPRTGIISVRSF